MARTPRSRQRTSSITGTITYRDNGVIWQGPTTATFNETSTCQDFIGRPITTSSLNSQQKVRTLRLEGAASRSLISGHAYSVEFSNYPIQVPSLSVSWASLNVPSGWHLTTVARSNPSRPVVTPLTLMQDVIELPKMLRDIGHNMTKPKRLLSAKELANQNLAAQFGWMPLIRDINQLLDLQSAIHKRKTELQRLYSGKGLRRRITFDKVTRSGRELQSIAYGGGGKVNYTFDTRVENEQWATIRWKPTTLPASHPSDAEMNQLARKVVLGFTPEGLASGAWDVVPWTWLVGWFTNAGDFMKRFSNTVPAAPSEACFMNQQKITCVPASVSVEQTQASTVRLVGVYSWITKTRVVSSVPTLGFNVPFVDTNRLSILSSLFVQRFVR